ncbi:hypothetical protein B9Z19DRAFT_1161197 [Tuber borchii]|uniref:Secreted protein n=1 Tax=Tuber borchii TaxID=42251 RepID=A0A2T6ZED0_TUBBO|nr:hypothetical protein B9Z19DRAFT_1161197 [Tuber borchii]
MIFDMHTIVSARVIPPLLFLSVLVPSAETFSAPSPSYPPRLLERMLKSSFSTPLLSLERLTPSWETPTLRPSPPKSSFKTSPLSLKSCLQKVNLSCRALG